MLRIKYLTLSFVAFSAFNAAYAADSVDSADNSAHCAAVFFISAKYLSVAKPGETTDAMSGRLSNQTKYMDLYKKARAKTIALTSSVLNEDGVNKKIRSFVDSDNAQIESAKSYNVIMPVLASCKKQFELGS